MATDSPAEAAFALVDALVDDSSEIVTVLVGADARTTDTQRVREHVEHRPSRGRGRGARRGSTAVPVLDRSGVVTSRTLRSLARTSLSEVPGIPARILDKLAALSPPIVSVLDLLGHYPRRYHDRTRQSEIAELAVGEEATIVAEVERISARLTRQRKKMVEAVVEDGSGLLNLVFFNQPWREKQLPPGTEVALYGKLDVYRGKRQLTNPIVDVLGRAGDAKTGVVVPIYAQSGKADLSTWEIEPVVAETLDWVGDLIETLPADVLAELKLEDRTLAYRNVHAPVDVDAARRAQRRLRFDEFLRMQVGLVARKRAIEAEATGIAHTVDGPLSQRFLASLPFELTGDQQAAIDEIASDLAASGADAPAPPG